MKKFMITLVALITLTVSARAMSYEQARNEALFLTDKMAYELNLTDEQYEAAYEVNLDYLMGVTSYDDVYGSYWNQRNLDLSYILFDWQWSTFRAASYFYRPLYWNSGYWHFGIYSRYPHRDYFYFGRPSFYASYRGGHSWRCNNDRSWYHGRQDNFRSNGNRGGMRDGWNRGLYNNDRGSSTRTTVRSGEFGSFGGSNNNSSNSNRPGNNSSNSNGFSSNGFSSSRYSNSRSNGTSSNRGFGSMRNSSSSSYSGNSSNNSNYRSNSSSSSSNSSSSRGFGSMRNSSSYSSPRSSSSSSSYSSPRSSSSSSSFSGSSTRSSGSFSGGSTRSSGSSNGGSSHSSGGFGSRR